MERIKKMGGSRKRNVRHHPPQKKVVGKGTANRTLVFALFITIIFLSIIEVSLFSSFFISSGQASSSFFFSALTGRSVQTSEGYEADISLTDNVLKVMLKVSDTGSVNGVSFTLAGTNLGTNGALFDSCDYTFRSLLDWEFPLTGCSSQQISYGAATLDPDKFKSGSFDVAEFTFPNMGYGEFEFMVSDLKVWDTTTTTVINLFANNDEFAEQFVRDAPPVIPPTVPAAGDSAGRSAGGGGPAGSSAGNSIECISRWQCADWTECRNGQQRRSCHDLNNCAQNTSTKIGFKIYPVIPAGPEEPEEMRSCYEEGLLPLEQIQEQVQEQMPPVVQQKRSEQQVQQSFSFVQKYKSYLIALPLLLIAALLAILTAIHHKHKARYNTQELKNWIRQERAAGTADKDISEIILDKTGWRKGEVKGIFQELGTS